MITITVGRTMRLASLLSTAMTLVVGLQGAPAMAQNASASYIKAFRYDAGGRILGTISAAPAVGGNSGFLAVRNSYDSFGRLSTVESGTLSSWQADSVAPANWTGFTVVETVSHFYDANGRKIKDVTVGSDGAKAVAQFSYDSYDRLVCSAVRLDSTHWDSQSDACTPQTTDPVKADRITHTSYDALDRPLVVQRAYGTSLQQNYATYTYSATGKVTSVTDANGNKATMTYDAFDRRATWNFPSPTAAGQTSTTDNEAYSYDANDNRIGLKKRDNNVICTSMDAFNRVSVKFYPVGASADQCGNLTPSGAQSVFYGYDFEGHQVYARFGSSSGLGVTDAFDGLGRKKTSTTSMGGVTRTLSYQYDADGDRTQVMHPDSAHFDMSYDGLDRMARLAGSGTAPAIAIMYNAAGLKCGLLRVTDTSSRNCTTDGPSSYATYGYDGLSRLTSQGQRFAGSGGTLSTTLVYNPANQIISETNDNDTFAYTGAWNVNRTYTPNGLNQYKGAGTANYGYDANGNLNSQVDTSGHDPNITYSYDVENRLTGTSNGLALTYDPLGRLFQISGPGVATTQFLYDGDNLVAEYDGVNHLLTRYAFGPGSDAPLIWDDGGALNCSGTKYLYSDHQGSVIATADCSGNRLDINSYDEYGVPGYNNKGRFQYTGQAWLPELGFYYYKARFYSPTSGRFLQTDPIGYKDQINLYAYVANDPVNHADPNGKECTDSAHKVVCTFHIFLPQGQQAPTSKQLQQIKNFERNYIKDVISIRSSNRSVTVGPTGGRPDTAFKTNGKEVGSSLYDRSVSIRVGGSSGNALLDTGGNPLTQKVFTNVYQSELDRSDLEQREDIAHEGIHSTMSEILGNPLSPYLGNDPYQDQHQIPYNKAAKELTQ